MEARMWVNEETDLRASKFCVNLDDKDRDIYELRFEQGYNAIEIHCSSEHVDRFLKLLESAISTLKNKEDK
jgi:hypothetical protein